MSSLWTNKYAILKDLSLAQGCEVPADLEATLAAGDKPPALKITEETEEEFFKKCNISQDVEGTIAPDFGLIQQMLKMIQPDSSDSEDNNSTVQIYKPELVTKKNTESKVDCAIKTLDKFNMKAEIRKKAKKRRENVAVNSILQGLLDVTPVVETKTEPKMKLLKPIDFMSVNNGTVESIMKLKVTEYSQKHETKKEIDSNDKANDCLSQHQNLSPMDESIVKVNGWLDSNKSNGSEHNNLLDWQPKSMFKKKSIATRSLESGSVNSSPEQKSDKKSTTMYRPSTLADEYCKKYIERSKVNTIVREDVWSRAERIMKELDEKKKLENEIAPVLQQQQMDTVTNNAEIELPQHRHLLTGDCIVCQIFKKNGIHITIIENIRSKDFTKKVVEMNISKVLFGAKQLL